MNHETESKNCVMGGACSLKGEYGDLELEDNTLYKWYFYVCFNVRRVFHLPTLSTSLVFLWQRENMKSNKNWSSDITYKPLRFASNSHIIVWETEREKNKLGWTEDHKKKMSVSKVSACAWVQSAMATTRE